MIFHRAAFLVAFFFTTALSVVCFLPMAAQQYSKELPEDTLATVGGQPIRAKDFLERYELMPWPQKDKKALTEVNKLAFLQSLVAEKLLSFEAVARNIGEDSTTRMMKYGMERFFVKDELYKQEVFPKIRISAQDVQSGLRKYASQLQVAVLRVLSQEEGELLYGKIAKSRNADSTLRFYRDSLFMVLDTAIIDYGGADIPIENAGYALTERGISHPFQSEAYGLVMVRLLTKYTNPRFVNASKPDQIAAVESILRGRQQDSLAASFFSHLLAPQRAEADPVVFTIVADSMFSMLTRDSLAHKQGGLYLFSTADVLQLTSKLQPYLDAVFVTSRDDTMNVREVLELLKYNKIVFPSLKRNIVQAILNNNIKTVVQNELLAREGFRRNLQQSENVRHDLGVWMDSRREWLLVQEVADTVPVSEREILDYYRRNAELFGAKVEVNVREILVDSVGLAQHLRKRIDSGENMAELARKYSKRQEWALRGGESGFFPITEHGDLGFYASSADTGEIIGPLRVQDGITIFTLMGKRHDPDSVKQDFVRIRKSIAEKLRREKQQKVLDKFIAGLARKYGVTLNEEKLRRVKTLTSSMFTWRHIGWGGVIMAVPTVMPQTGWIQELRKSTEINP